MKTTILFFFLLVITAIDVSSQINKEPTDLLDRIYINKIIKFDSVTVSGSPFLDSEFKLGTVEDNSGNVYNDVLLRYNVFNDNFEFRKEGIAYMLEPGITAVTAKIENHIFVWSEFIDDGKPAFGYMEVLAAGYSTLYKKHNKAYYPPKPPAPFQESSPAGRFGKMTPKYYIGLEGKLLMSVGSEKALLKIFENRSSLIKSFIKNNKLRFRNEKDLIEIIRFINDSR